MKLGFSGSRLGMTWPQFYSVFTLVTVDLRPAVFSHGDCVGSDSQAHYLVFHHLQETVIRVHPPNKDVFRAYCLCRPNDVLLSEDDYISRNQNIVRESDMLLATPATMGEQPRGGTWSTIRHAKKMGIPSTIVYPDGSVVKRPF